MRPLVLLFYSFSVYTLQPNLCYQIAPFYVLTSFRYYDESFDTCYDSDEFSSLAQSGFDDPDSDPYRLEIAGTYKLPMKYRLTITSLIINITMWLPNRCLGLVFKFW